MRPALFGLLFLASCAVMVWAGYRFSTEPPANYFAIGVMALAWLTPLCVSAYELYEEWRR